MRSEELAGIGLCWKADVMKSKKKKNPGCLCYSERVKEKYAAAQY